MKAFLLTVAFLAALGCEISPVVSAPSEGPGTRYSDCDRAARDYCEHVVEAKSREMDSCSAEYRYKCVSSRARLAPTRAGRGEPQSS